MLTGFLAFLDYVVVWLPGFFSISHTRLVNKKSYLLTKIQNTNKKRLETRAFYDGQQTVLLICVYNTTEISKEDLDLVPTDIKHSVTQGHVYS